MKFAVGAPFFYMFSFHFVVVCYISKDIGHIKRSFFAIVCVKKRSEWTSERANEWASNGMNMHFVYTLSKDVCCVLIMYSCISKSSAWVSLSMIVRWRFRCIIGCICTLYFFLLYSLFPIYIYILADVGKKGRFSDATLTLPKNAVHWEARASKK